MLSTKFYFDGTYSDDMGVYLVRLNSGLVSVPYIPSREVIEDYPVNARAPFVHKARPQQFNIKMTFSTLSNNLTDSNLKTIASWLFQENYCEFYSEDNPDKIYYLMAVSQVDVMKNVGNEGYFEVEFRSKFPYCLTAETTPTFNIAGITNFNVENECNVYEYFYPEMEITIGGNSTTPIRIVNDDDSDRLTKIENLTDGEVIYLNNEKKQLISSLGNYRYDDFNKNWLRLKQGSNNIIVQGYCDIVFRMQFPTYS
jgi:phage-related protein